MKGAGVCIHMYVNDVYIHVLMRDEKEGRKKQGQTNNKAKQHSIPKAGVHVLMRDEKEGRKKQARSNKHHSKPKADVYTCC